MTGKKVYIIISTGQTYDQSVQGGRPYISVQSAGRSYGYSAPCDTEEQVKRAVEHAKEFIRREGDFPIVKDERVTLTQFFQ